MEGGAITPARSAEHWRQVRRLFEEYAAGLGFDLGFQDFEAELAELPGDYAEPRGCVLLARAAGEVVGCVGLRPLEGATCEMKRLYVCADRRRGGLGRDLVRAIVDEAERRGYERIRLDTVPSMKAARRIYRELGFEVIAPYRHNPIPGTVFMERRLGSGSVDSRAGTR